MKEIDAFKLKIIAIIAMFINHSGYVFAYQLMSISIYLYIVTLWIGRLTFPILAFLLVEGFKYTKNLKKYFFRLFIFWIISIYPYYLVFTANNRDFKYIDLINNVFFTLFISLLVLFLCSKTNNIVIECIIVIGFAILTYWSDWGFMGIFMVFGFYKIKDPTYKKIIPVIYTGILFFIKMLPEYMNNPFAFPMSFLLSSLGVFLAIPLLIKYNGKRGINSQVVKWSFYIFYPAHLLILGIIQKVINLK